MTTGDTAESALLIAVPEVEEVVRDWREVVDPAARLGVPAHITLLYPFAPPDRITDDMLSLVNEAVAQSRAFDFVLRAIGWLGEQVVYLAPDPEAPFLRLIDSLVAAFPEYPPYGGRFVDVIPHLTVGDGVRRGRLQEAADAIERRLPIPARANQVLLMTGGTATNSWAVRERFALAES